MLYMQTDRINLPCANTSSDDPTGTCRRELEGSQVPIPLLELMRFRKKNALKFVAGNKYDQSSLKYREQFLFSHSARRKMVELFLYAEHFALCWNDLRVPISDAAAPEQQLINGYTSRLSIAIA